MGIKYGRRRIGCGKQGDEANSVWNSCSKEPGWGVRNFDIVHFVCL